MPFIHFPDTLTQVLFFFSFSSWFISFGMVTPLFNLWLSTITKEGKNLDRWSIREGSEASYCFSMRGSSIEKGVFIASIINLLYFTIAFKEAGEALGGLGGVQGTFEFSHQIDQVFSSCLLSPRREGDHWEGWSIGKEVRHSVHFSHHIFTLYHTIKLKPHSNLNTRQFWHCAKWSMKHEV